MLSSISGTSSTKTLGGTSLLNKQISTPVTQVSTQTMLPYINNLPAGKYRSEIIDVADAVQNNFIVGIDCTHKLTDSGGSTMFVKFRFFDPIDTEALAQVLSSYGFTGNIGAALFGLQETVDIAPRPKSNRYMYIASRSLLLNSAASTSTAATTPTIAPASKPSGQSKGSLSSRLSSKHSNKPVQTPRQALISEDDDDEFDDFLDESDE